MRSWLCEGLGILTVSAAVSGVSVAQTTTVHQSPSSPVYANTTEAVQTHTDTTVSPCVNFYQYANGNWLRHAVITPADTARDRLWGVTIPTQIGMFTEVAHHTRAMLQHILETAREAAATTADPVIRVVGRYYGSCMLDSATDMYGQPLSADAHSWQCFAATDSVLPAAIDELFTRAVLPPPTRAKATSFVASIQEAAERRFRRAQWAGESTRARAIRKAKRYTAQIGSAPLAADTYRTLDLSPTNYTTNRQILKAFVYQQQLQTIGHPRERSRFRSYMINATENELESRLELPTVLWAPPLFDPTGDPAANYGGAGMLISHEFMHAFGRVNHTWLDARDTAAFEAEQQRLIRQADAYPIGPDTLHFDGTRTLEENLADIDGLRVAYDAFMHTVSVGEDHSRASAGAKAMVQATAGPESTPPTSRPRTPAQRFFLAFANFMRERPLVLKDALNDTHAPYEFRVNGPLSNMPEFARAFGCRAGDPMVQPVSRRVEIW